MDVTNLLHQNFTLEDLGKHKANIVAEKCFVTPQLRFMTPKDFKNYDVIFSCVDGMELRNQLYSYGYKHPELFWIDGRCNSRTIVLLNSTMGQRQLKGYTTEDKDKARAGCLKPEDKANLVSHATPIIVAGLMTQTFLNYLRDEETKDPLTITV